MANTIISLNNVGKRGKSSALGASGSAFTSMANFSGEV